MSFFRRKQESFDALIVGLGNPGPRYSATRHNAGWWVLDILAKRYKPYKTTALNRSQADFTRITSADGLAVVKCALVKPTTFMNVSGESVRAWRKQHAKARLLVVYDDCSMELGKLRLREKGSAGGHNGVKSLIAQLGTDEFDRLKIGIGFPPAGMDSADYVLTRPSSSEEKALAPVLELAADIVERYCLGATLEQLKGLTGGALAGED